MYFSSSSNPGAGALYIKFLYVREEDKCLLVPKDQPHLVYAYDNTNSLVASKSTDNAYWKINLLYNGKLLTPSY